MSSETLELVRALAVVGLITGTAAYFLLVRRRRQDRHDAQERLREESNSRAMARFRQFHGGDEAGAASRSDRERRDWIG